MREFDREETCNDVIWTADEGQIRIVAKERYITVAIGDCVISTRKEINQLIMVLNQALEERKRLGGDIDADPDEEEEEEDPEPEVCHACGQDLE